MTNIEKVKEMYNLCAEYEQTRLSRSPIHELEFVLSTDILKQYISPGSQVLDLGSGPGIYSEYLINKMKCQVGLVDLSSEELNLFKQRIHPKVMECVQFTKVSSATEISWIKDSSFDHILIQGPLYHLTEESERTVVLQHAHRILRPGGIIFCAFISPHRKYATILQNGAELIRDENYIVNLKKGIVFHTCAGETAAQYRCWPKEAIGLISNSNFEILHCRNLEGIFSYLPSEQFPLLKDPLNKSRFIEIARSTCEEPSLLGSTLHYLVAAQKKNVI